MQFAMPRTMMVTQGKIFPRNMTEQVRVISDPIIEIMRWGTEPPDLRQPVDKIHPSAGVASRRKPTRLGPAP
jgi:hypothetical protein